MNTESVNWKVRELSILDSMIELGKSEPEKLIAELERKREKVQSDLTDEFNVLKGQARRLLDIIAEDAKLLGFLRHIVQGETE